MRHCHFIFIFSLLTGAALVCQPPAAWSQIPSTGRITGPTMSQCGSCHGAHGAGFISAFTNSTALCLSCHDPALNLVPSEYQVTNHTGSSGTTYVNIPGDSTSGPFFLECLDCHNHHYNVLNLRGIEGGALVGEPGPPDQDACADTDNTQICLNFKMLGTAKVDAAGYRKSLPDDTLPVRLLTPGRLDLEANCLASGTNSNPANPGIPVYDDPVGHTNYLGCARIMVGGRRLPLDIGKGQSAVTYNDWASETKPYQGICNQCHTRTQHHRNNDVEAGDDCQPSGNDHTHNANKRCTACHDHSSGFSKNQNGSCTNLP